MSENLEKKPLFTIRDLLEAGVHYGHHVRRWNPRMAPYIFGARHDTHILDLRKTAPLLHQALLFVKRVVADGGRVLFVGTKPQASALVKEAASKCGQYYVNHRWLGGMLTNWETVSQSIRRLSETEKRLEEAQDFLVKKELLGLERKREKLDKALGGIRDMGSRPDVVFIIDTHREEIALREANRLGLPVVGIVDSNANPEKIDYPIPGNDDSTRAITLYCDLMVEAVVQGLRASEKKFSTRSDDGKKADDARLKKDDQDFMADMVEGSDADKQAKGDTQ